MARERKKKNMSEAMKKLKESNDEKKIELAEKLVDIMKFMISLKIDQQNLIFLLKKISMGHIIVPLIQRGIAGVIKALGNDEELDPFTKYLMFTHMYTPEQVKEIGHEEIHRREEKFEKELGLV